MKDLTTEFTVGAIALQGVSYATGVTKLNMKSILAGCIVCLGLSALSNVDHRISTGLAALIFFAIAVKVLPDVMAKIGLDSGGFSRDYDSSAAKKPKKGTDDKDGNGQVKEPGLEKDSNSVEKNPQFTPEQPNIPKGV